jgi:hypothetical protein
MPNDDPFKDLVLTQDQLEQLKKPQIVGTPWAECLCRKLLNVITWQRKWHSGRWVNGKEIEPGVNYTDLLCEDCRKEFHNWPRIVCLGCRRLMGFYRPGKQSTGFVFEMGRHYHILDCPRCNPTRRSTPVLEHEKFCRDNGIPTKTNKDLLQEIEQKVLHAEAEAAKLRAEFEASKTQ